MKTKLSMLAGFIIGGVLLYFAFRSIDFARMLEICRGAKYIYLVPVVFTIMAELLLRGLKWKLLLDPAAKVRLWDAFRLQGAGIALNNVLPLRLGEIMRGTIGARIFNIPVMTVFATILVERALDVIVLFLLLGAAVALGSISGGYAGRGPYLLAVFAALAAGIGVLVFVDEIVEHHLLSGFFERFPRFKKLLAQLALGVRGFHTPKGAALLVFTGCAQWLLDALNCYWMALAFSIDNVVGAAKSVVLVFTGAVACSVPGMPGFFGNYEASIAGVLGTWGVPRETGLAYATYGHVSGYILLTVIGLVFTYQMGYSLSRVWAQFGDEAGKKPEAD